MDIKLSTQDKHLYVLQTKTSSLRTSSPQNKQTHQKSQTQVTFLNITLFISNNVVLYVHISISHLIHILTRKTQELYLQKCNNPQNTLILWLESTLSLSQQFLTVVTVTTTVVAAAAVRMIFPVFRFLMSLFWSFPFHSTILEPDFHLCFRQHQVTGDFKTLRPRQILVRFELLFQL